MEDNQYYRSFLVKTMTLKIIPRNGVTEAKAEMYISLITGGDLNIVLHSPSLKASGFSDLNELAANLADVTEVICHREPCDGIIKCLVDIYREDGLSESIWCEDIEGLPD